MAQLLKKDNIWDHYTDEERSYVILTAYKTRILKSEELKKFIRQNRILNWTTWLYPLVGYPFVSKVLLYPFREAINHRMPGFQSNGIKITVLLASWALWLNISPFYHQLENTKEGLLQDIFEKVGCNFNHYNDVLPRHWTSQEVNRQIVQLYNQRNSILAGYLYPEEDIAVPLVDQDTWPKEYKRGKIRK